MILSVVGVWNDPKKLDIRSVKKNHKTCSFWIFSFDYFQVFYEQQEYTIEVKVKPGQVIQFIQNIGVCGGNEVYTLTFDELPFQSKGAPSYLELENTTDTQRGAPSYGDYMAIPKNGTPLTTSQCASTILVLICCKINILI